jgi:hypothetical protein
MGEGGFLKKEGHENFFTTGMSSFFQPSVVSDAMSGVQRKCEQCAEEKEFQREPEKKEERVMKQEGEKKEEKIMKKDDKKEESIQMKETGTTTSRGNSDTNYVESINSKGQPLAR